MYKQPTVYPKRPLSFPPREPTKKLKPNRVPASQPLWLAAHVRQLASAWWQDISAVGEKRSLFGNFNAGLTVAAIAVPLNLALAIASGLPPIVGLISGGVGGIVAAFFGGSRWQVTGPAAALNSMVGAMVAQHGVGAAAAGAMMVGIIQILLCLGSAGRLIRYVPEAVLAGFTTGVGLKLLAGQFPVFLGVENTLNELLEHFHNPVWLHHVSWFSVLTGLFVMITILSFRSMPRFPAALLGIALVSSLSMYLKWDVLRVGVIPNEIPDAALPSLTFEEWIAIALQCLPLGLLAAAESLLSAQALDRMAQKSKHHSDLELFGQGMGNLFVGLFGGMPVSGVIVRGTANVQAGGKSRWAAILHGIALLMAIVFVGRALSIVPLAALAGLLCVVGFRLIEVKTLVHLLKDHRAHALAFACSAAGTLSGYLVTGLTAGLLICWLDHWQSQRKQSLKSRNPETEPGIRAIIEASHPRSPKPLAPATKPLPWSQHIGEQPLVASTAFVHPNASIIGRVVLDHGVHVASEAALRADEGTPFFVGRDTNIQDGVVFHALKGQWVTVDGTKWAIYVGQSASMAHQALIHGPCYIGHHVFVGFKAVVHNSVIGDYCFIGIGAVVVGVEVPSYRYVPNGMIVDTLEKANQLPIVTPEQAHFNADVVEVNQGLAEAYRHKTENPQAMRLVRPSQAFTAVF